MNKIWYNKPSILFENYQDFFPKKNMNKIEKINAIARFSIYYTILIIILKLDGKWLAISFILLFLSIFLGESEHFNDGEICTKPTKENPFMNFTVGDLINNPQRPGACPVLSVRNEQLKLFKSNNIFVDNNDLWGKYQSDRNFYTMPSTEIVNDQSGFARYLYNNFKNCKNDGYNCLKYTDNRYQRGRHLMFK